MRRALVALALVASGVLLVGCVALPPMPEKITPAEAQEQLDRRNLEWWNAMFPDEPMPTVRVVAPIAGSNTVDAIRDCMQSAQIPGVTFSTNGWSAEGNEAVDAINRVSFVCTLRFPQDLSDPSSLGMISSAESEWLYNYNTKRLVPCLQLMGYRIKDTSTQLSPDQRGYWVPYYEMRPVPSEAEWLRIDAECPPAPIGPDFTEGRPSRG